MTIKKGEHQIIDLEAWRHFAGPKSEGQWVDDRSAKELARCWLAVTAPALPQEVEALLASHPAFGSVSNWTAEPEVRLPFDHLPGEPRNTDLAVQAEDRFGRFLMAIEAKADEPFAETVAATLAAAVERKLAKPTSNGVLRVEKLAEDLFGARQKLPTLALGGRERLEPFLGDLRYQLLTATAGAVRWAEACGVSRVVLLVHEFWTKCTKDRKHLTNAVDLGAFMTRLSHGRVETVDPGVLYGPFTIPGQRTMVAPPALFVGKAQRDLRV